MTFIIYYDLVKIERKNNSRIFLIYRLVFILKNTYIYT